VLCVAAPSTGADGPASPSTRSGSALLHQPPPGLPDGRPARVGAPTVVAAGDISAARLAHQRATSALVTWINPTRVLALGDEQYNSGAYRDFVRYYGPTWGRFRSKTMPAPGNHEYRTPHARGYFRYFGTASHPNGVSYFSANLGGWHLISLDSNIARASGSAQLRWLRSDLAATTQRCILAFWHHPRFSSGTRHGDDRSVSAFWDALYAQHADLILNGHEHNYERFARQDPSARATSAGIREFVVGTGGIGHYPFGAARATSEVRIPDAFGVLKLRLRPGSYTWQFVDARHAIRDSGGPVPCHS
jgi:hypothetical protein